MWLQWSIFRADTIIFIHIIEIYLILWENILLNKSVNEKYMKGIKAQDYKVQFWKISNRNIETIYITKATVRGKSK